MGLHYEHTPPTQRDVPVAIVLGFTLGIIITLIIVHTWIASATVEQHYTSDGHTYRIVPAEDGSPYIYRDDVRMYLTSEPPYGQ